MPYSRSNKIASLSTLSKEEPLQKTLFWNEAKRRVALIKNRPVERDSRNHAYTSRQMSERLVPWGACSNLTMSFKPIYRLFLRTALSKGWWNFVNSENQKLSFLLRALSAEFKSRSFDRISICFAFGNLDFAFLKTSVLIFFIDREKIMKVFCRSREIFVNKASDLETLEL